METEYTDNTQAVKEIRVDEFSPQKFIIQVQDTFAHLFSKWLKILLFATLAGVAALTYYSFKKDFYTAEISFALDEEATQKAQDGFVEIGEQLGLGSSSIDASAALFGSMTNIVELMQSRLLIEKTLRDSIVLTLNAKPLIFADFFLDSLKYRAEWLAGGEGEKLAFNSKNDSLLQNRMIAGIFETLKGRYIKVDRKGKGTSIISVSCNTEHEFFSKYFLEALVKNVTEYYTEIKTQRAKANLLFIEHRMDSIRPAYTGALYGRAAFADAHTNAIRQVAIVSNEKQQTDVQILKAAYIELSRNLEVAKIALSRVTPLIQYMDKPILPLKKSGRNNVKTFIIFFVAGAMITILILFLMYTVRSIMGTNKPAEEEYYYPPGVI